MIDREMGNIVGIVEDRIQNAIMAVIDNTNTPRIKLAVMSVNASSGRDAASVVGNSERGDRIRITASFEKVTWRNFIYRELNTNDETSGKFPIRQLNRWSRRHIFTGKHTRITWLQVKEPKQIKSLYYWQAVFPHHMAHHHRIVNVSITGQQFTRYWAYTKKSKLRLNQFHQSFSRGNYRDFVPCNDHKQIQC